MKPIEVKTSGFENLCAFYALFNSIGGKPREIRQEVYARMGLNSNVADQYFVESIFPLVEDFHRISEFKRSLESNDALALSEILKYQKEMFVAKNWERSEMIQVENEVKRNLELNWQNPEMKKELIDTYANFLFCGNRNRIEVDFNKFPNANRRSSPYNLEEFSELIRIYKNSNDQDLLGNIDNSICYSKIEDKMVPSVALKFLANFCHQKLWIGNWQNESRDHNGEIERVLYEETGNYINPFGASDNLLLQDLNFLVQKLGLKSNLRSTGVGQNISDLRAVNFSNPGHGHWTGVVDFKSLQHKGDGVYAPLEDRDLVLLTPAMTALSTGVLPPNPPQLSIEEQYTKACMDLLRDENISRIFQAFQGQKEGKIIEGTKFFRNESMHSCIELNGNIFTLNVPRINPNAKDGNVEIAKSDLIRNVEYLKNLSKQPSQATYQASASIVPGVGTSRHV